MTTTGILELELMEFLPKELNIRVPAIDTDLFKEGIIDSFGLVNLLFLIESRWGIKVSVEQMELENFSTVERIANFIESEQD